MQFADHIQNYMQEGFFFIISALKLRLTPDNLGFLLSKKRRTLADSSSLLYNRTSCIACINTFSQFNISLYNSFMKESGFEIVTGIRKVKFISTKIIQLVLNRIHRRSSQFS